MVNDAASVHGSLTILQREQIALKQLNGVGRGVLIENLVQTIQLA
jgi:hypothetical protein